MKERLALLYDPYRKKKKFRAVFARYGQRPSGRPVTHPEPFPTALLTDVRHKPRGKPEFLAAEHVWIGDATAFPALTPGQVITFTGLIDMFPKGSFDIDFDIRQVEGVRVEKTRKQAK